MKVGTLQRKSGQRKSTASLIFEAIAAPIFVLQSNHIVYANAAAAELLKTSQEDILEKDFRLFLQREPRAGDQEPGGCLQALARGGESFACRAVLAPASGQGAAASLAFQKVDPRDFGMPENPEPAYVVTVHALPAGESGGWPSAMADVIGAIPDAVVILNTAGLVTEANPAAVALIGFDPTGRKREEVFSQFNIRDLDGEPVALEALPFYQVAEGEQVRSKHYRLRTAGGQEVELMVSASPIYSDGRMTGVVSVWSDVSELSQRRHELEALAGVASALRSAIVQEDMFPVFLEQLISLLRVDGASLLMPDQATGEMIVRRGMGEWARTTGLRLSEGHGVSWQVLSSGEPYLNNEIQKDSRLVHSVFSGSMKSGVCVALSSHGVIIGVLWVGRDAPFNQDDLRLLNSVADIAASNLYRARLFEQTQLRFQRLSALHSIDMAITSSLDLQLTLSVLLDQTVTQMRVDAADILRFDPALHWLEYASGRGFIHSVARADPRGLNDSPAGQVAIERRTISIPDLNQVSISTEYWLSPDEGFQAYFAAPLIAKGQVKGVIELYLREPFHPDAEWLEFFDTLATQAAIAIDSAELFERLQHSNEELSLAYDATIEGWSHALELRDQETHGHAQRVTRLTIQLARRLGVRDDEIPHYRRGVLLHDIGKMAIPDSILLKDGPLTSEEQEVMRRHPTYAYELLHPIAYLRPALDIPYAHHEWWDGSGYPRGLKGEEIPLPARIFSVIDVWDALRSDRSYRLAWPIRKVVDHIRSLSGSHFDPMIVDEFTKMLQETGMVRA